MNSLLATLFSGILYLFCWPSEKDRLNAQMAELCAKDGGVKVYEKVELPSSMFDKTGNLKENKLTKKNDRYELNIANQYVLFDDVTTIVEGDPKRSGKLWKLHSIVRRLSDNKIIGEAVEYHRSGGDLWYAGMPSAEACPKSINLFDEVFSKHGK